MHAMSMRTQVKSCVREPLVVHTGTYPETLIQIPYCLAHSFHMLCLFLKPFYVFICICASVLYACLSLIMIRLGYVCFLF